MNRNENQMIIKALNMFGRVPEQYELLEEIERLKIIEEKYKDSQLYIHDFKEEIEKLNNIINELHSDLKTLWIVLWNMDTEMTGYQNEVFDKYYDEFHKDGDKTNNNIDNLEYCSRKQNIIHSWQNGLSKPHDTRKKDRK